ncbi:hypothetical protein ETAA8_70670 [Anatilimnocola aggregata]|uniref:DUF4190 domain-containing protein n=1 Tax=Anatilimnocola aggregata TaxID=2528021 RepID=A0A517YNU9_9BACT|nr:DUF4190 domain-containing protein [Anatilimnocola aggregata]QDU31905.1 hypothetical protein ETAA8_70670 [Anatilimnocola aggregata]
MSTSAVISNVSTEQTAANAANSAKPNSPALSPLYGDEAEMMPYRALSRSAVVSVVLAVVSLLGYLFEPMLVVALAGLVMGLIALQAIRRYPLEYTGRGVALFGAVLSGLIFVSGAAMHTYIYFTELPEDHIRLSFSKLQPDYINEPERAFPASALELNGKKVFVKGYTHKFIAQMGKVDHFILVPDLGECCFGDKQTKPTHMIEVKVTDPRYKVKYALRRLKLAGEFTASEVPDQSLGVGTVYYHLKANKIE